MDSAVVSTLTFIHSSTNGSTALVGLGRFFRFLILHTVGRTPRAGDQPVARRLPTQDNTNTNIHDLSSIRTHDPSVSASEVNSCLKPRGNHNRLSTQGVVKQPMKMDGNIQKIWSGKVILMNEVYPWRTLL
jgi:hypothetical protein